MGCQARAPVRSPGFSLLSPENQPDLRFAQSSSFKLSPVTSNKTCDSPEKPAAWGSQAGVLTAGKREFHGWRRPQGCCVGPVKLHHSQSLLSADVLPS